MSGLVEALELFRAAWPRQPIGDVAIRVYAHQLRDLRGEDVYAAIDWLSKTSEFPPSIATIRRTVVERHLALPDAEEAWDLALRGDLSNPVVRAAAKAVGGTWSIRHTDRPETLRAQFRKTYENRREIRIRDAAAGEPLTPDVLIDARREAEALPAGVESINGRRYLALPETTRIRPRPVTLRMAQRYAGRVVPPPGPEDVADAFLILRDGPDDPENPAADPLYREAEAIHRDATADPVRLRDATNPVSEGRRKR